MGEFYCIKKSGKYWTGSKYMASKIGAMLFCSKWEASEENTRAKGSIEKR